MYIRPRPGRTCLCVCAREYRGKSWKVDYTEDLPRRFLFCVGHRAPRKYRYRDVAPFKGACGRKQIKSGYKFISREGINSVRESRFDRAQFRRICWFFFVTKEVCHSRSVFFSFWFEGTSRRVSFVLREIPSDSIPTECDARCGSFECIFINRPRDGVSRVSCCVEIRQK